MTQNREAISYPVTMEVASWLLIDGTMDNEISDLVTEGYGAPEGMEDDKDYRDPYFAELTQLGVSIREAGWAQLPDWPKTARGMRSWPAPGRTETMMLNLRQWSLVATALEESAEIEEEMGRTESAATSRRLAVEVRNQLRKAGITRLPDVKTRAD